MKFHITLQFQLTLPAKNKRVKDNFPRRNYVNVYFGLPPKLVKKLKRLAKKQTKSESEILRKTSPVGTKVLPRTIRKEQDRRSREIANKTGRAISELVREAVEEFG